MGLIAKIIDSFTGDDNGPAAKIEIYKNDNINSRIFLPPGVDARPLDGDIGFSQDSEDTEGAMDVLGFNDPKNEPVAKKGEFKIYSRDSSGNIKASIHLKADGSIEINAPAGLKISANTEITGTLTVSGIIKSMVDIIADFSATAIKLLTHFHLGNLGYNTGVPVAGSGTPKPAGSPTGDSSGNLVMNNKEILNIGTAGTSYSTHGHEQSSDSGGDTENKTDGPS